MRLPSSSTTTPLTSATRYAAACAALAVCSFTTSIANAEAVEFTIDGSTSSAEAVTDLSSVIPASLIGNWDPETNPGGTLTRPGLFGGEGNQPIDIDIEAFINGTVNSQPTGSYVVDFDLNANTIDVSGLTIDVLGETPGILSVNSNVGFGTFRSFQPDALFPGGTYPVPLGDGSIVIFSGTQSAPSVGGILIPDPNDDDHYTFSVGIPATFNVQALFLDQPVSPGPIDAIIPVTGDVFIDGVNITIVQSISILVEDSIVDPPDSDFADVPFELPTILPPGDIANVLLSGTVASVNTTIDLDLAFTSTGELDISTPGDVDGDGDVDVEDLLALLGAWGDCLKGEDCPADFDGNGAVDVEDLLLLLANWS